MLQNGEGRLLNNRYQLLERFGTGGMANIYRARDVLLNRNVAIKVLRDDHEHNPDFEAQFRNEAQSVANLSHPNIVTVYDFGFDNGQPFIVMELVPGTDLKSLLRKRGRFTVEEGIPLIVQACAGIGYAHRAGVIHCDVKPHNMLVTPDKRLKVTDFGIARALATINPDERADVVWGSPQYFSPEQAAGLAPSPASDVYSLGVVLYEILTGTLPFTGSTAEELARQHLNADPVPPSEYVPDIPKALEEIILKVLAKEPSARYRTADQLMRVLMKFGTQRDIPTASPLNLTPEVAPASVWEAAPAPKPVAPPQPTQQMFEPFDWSALLSDIDWGSVALGLLALVAVFGLIPFWMWVYFTYNPPVK
ncbi:MAG: protein kinase [Chloroflexi bacterium]|nr:protein kinase [Chloroflexota bacterium]